MRRYEPFFARTAQSLSTGQGETGELRTLYPTSNISETGDEYVNDVEVSEVKREDIEVALTDGVLSITGERKHEKKSKDEKVHRVESFYGQFTRSFKIPSDGDPDNISAQSRDGIFTITIPQREEEKAEQMRIDVS